MYKAKDYSYLIGLPGFCQQSLELHFSLYQGYVKNSNLMIEKLKNMPKDEICFSELKRRFGWEFSGMRLHEYYFENLGRGKNHKSQEFINWIDYCFGSYEKWASDFKAIGMMRGIGWVVLFRDVQNGNLINGWIEQHNLNYLAGCQPLLVMDVWEHAYLCDYGTNRKKYIETFFENINWENVMKRFSYVTL